MPDFINLLNEIAGKESDSPGAKKRGKFRASIMTTYTAYLPFYENVVLRRLMASGCRYNVLLVDAQELVQSLQDSDRMPRLAGRNYVLVPMTAPKVFHPKLMMLLGEHNARILVGSHNATLSGFGHNRELTTRIDLAQNFSGEYRAFFQAAWNFIEAWLFMQQSRLPQSVSDAVMRVRTKYAPWLNDQETQTAEVRFFGSMPAGNSLWQEVRPFLPDNIIEVDVLGPFFDKEGEFLKKLHEEFSPRRITVGLDPKAKNSSICRLDGLPQQIKFHDASTLGAGEGYLHAKALFLTNTLGNSVLITGSANPSHPAWIANPSYRNAEAVVLHLGDCARQYTEGLGILSLSSMPKISHSQLQQIIERATSRLELSKYATPTRVVIAELTEDGVQLACPFNDNEEVLECRVQFDDQSFADNVAVEKQERHLLIKLAQGRDSIVRILLRLSDGSQVMAFVHNHRAVSQMATTSKQQSFRDALDSLGGASPDFAALLRIADKLIFDESEAKEAVQKNFIRKERSKEKDEDELEPLSVSVKETKRNQRRTRELYYGDLAYVINTLIYHLGIGLHNASEELATHTHSEEEKTEIEQDETDVLASEVNPFDLVKTCNRKVGTLVNRMCKHFEKAKPETSQAYKAVEQILAVLAVLREVRANDPKLAHLAGGTSLVPMKERRKLLQATLRALFGGDRGLFDDAAEIFKDDPDNDLERLLGLIIWLAWDCEIDPCVADNVPIYEFEAKREAFLELSNLLEIALRAGKKEEAYEEARRSALRMCPDGKRLNLFRWMRIFENWANELQEIDYWSKQGLRSEIAILGQIGKPNRKKESKPRIVLGTQKNFVLLAEISKTDNVVKFHKDSVSFFTMPELRNCLEQGAKERNGW